LRQAADGLFDTEHNGILPDERLSELEPFMTMASRSGHEMRAYDDALDFVAGRRDADQRAAKLAQLFPQGADDPSLLALLKAPLYSYQAEGALFAVTAGRALIGDDMGLGKTIQAISACALLHRLGKAQRVLVVTPASLKTEWEEQIRRFTTLDYRLVFGDRVHRLQAYRAEAGVPFFTLVNYEQMVPDALDVNARLRPDVVVLDEAQRIKNWSTKTAQAVKRLQSRYAFVLTGTPIENRIDELHSLMDFLNPAVLGPLFRFNRDFYELDERGRPIGYRNLDVLHQRIKPFMLRRLKLEVETELPKRTDHNRFVPLHPMQKQNYADHELD